MDQGYVSSHAAPSSRHPKLLLPFLLMVMVMMMVVATRIAIAAVDVHQQDRAMESAHATVASSNPAATYAARLPLIVVDVVDVVVAVVVAGAYLVGERDPARSVVEWVAQNDLLRSMYGATWPMPQRPAAAVAAAAAAKWHDKLVRLNVASDLMTWRRRRQADCPDTAPQNDVKVAASCMA